MLADIYTYMYMESANKMRIPLTICGFHLQFADSPYNLRIPLTVADSATAQFNDTNVLSVVPQTVLDSTNAVADSANSHNCGANLSGTMIWVSVCGIQNSIEDQRKVALLRIPRQN